MSKAHFLIYSDGASFNNGRRKKDLPQFASYGYVITLNEKILFKKAEGLGDTTISVAELTGAIKSIEKIYSMCQKISEDKLHKPYKITLVSDSEYVVKGFNERMEGWKNNKWCIKSGSKVANLELWKQLYNLKNNKDIDITLKHINSHTKKKGFDYEMNDVVDGLATAIVKEWKNKNKF